MARRLETVYVKTCLKLTEAELLEFIDLFAVQNQWMSLQVKVYDNGNQEVVIQDFDSKDCIKLQFERKDHAFVLTEPCRFINVKLANLMRKALCQYKGDALVHRVYPDCVMEYHYMQGSVIKIVELKDGEQHLVYEYKNRLGKLEQQYLMLQAEAEIQVLKFEVDRLLDMRYGEDNSEAIQKIDSKLQEAAKQLFLLEA